jgi:hypothetical protein
MRRETNPCAREVFHEQAKLPRISAHTLATHSRRRAKPPSRRSPGAGSGRLDWELLPARAKWKFVLGHLQLVLGERQPMGFFTLGGAVPSLLNTGISAGAEFFSFGSSRGHLGSSFLFRPLQFSKLKNSKCSFRRRVLHGIGFPHNQSSSAAGSRRLLLSCARCSW